MIHVHCRLFKELLKERMILPNVHLLLGSLANTNSDGVLNSPAPELLMADTRNSYSMPSTTSLTANPFAAQEK